MADVPHLVFPLRFVAGRFLAVEQGSPRHLQDQAEVVLRTRPLTFEHDPKFGLRDLVSKTAPAAPEVLAALERHVPGARFLAEDDERDLRDRVRRVHVELANEQEG